MFYLSNAPLNLSENKTWQNTSMQWFLTAWTYAEKLPTTHLCKSQLILHHLCDHSPLWRWVLGTITRYGKQNHYFCYLLLQNHARYQTKGLCLKPNTITYTLTKTEALIHCVRKRLLGFLVHLLCLPKEEPARKYAFYIPSHDKRRPGHPRTSYFAYNQRVLEYDKDDLLADQIATLVKDPCIRRTLVIGCSEAKWWWWGWAAGYIIIYWR